jgi:hypothetical protein
MKKVIFWTIVIALIISSPLTMGHLLNEIVSGFMTFFQSLELP